MPFVRKPVTIRELAMAVGLGRTAVSLALRKHPSIPPATRERVAAMAGKMGYRVHPLVAALMAHQRSAAKPNARLPLGLITRWEKQSPWKHGWVLPELYEGLRARAEERGYRVDEFWLRAPGMSVDRMNRILRQRAIPGVIILPLPVAHGHLSLDWEGFPAVTIGYSLARPALHRVTSHHVHSVQIAMRRLRRHGYRRIGLAMKAGENARVDGQWLAAFLLEQESSARGDRLPPWLPATAKWDRETFRRWLDRTKPEAILCVHATVLHGWLSELGLEVPKDVGLVNLYWRDCEAQFAGVDQLPQFVGSNVIDLLVDLMHLHESGLPQVSKTVLVEPVWRDGPSIRLLPGE